MASLNIFVSFEFEKGNNRKNGFLAQASKHAWHRVRNCSLGKAYDGEAWKERRERLYVIHALLH